MSVRNVSTCSGAANVSVTRRVKAGCCWLLLDDIAFAFVAAWLLPDDESETAVKTAAKTMTAMVVVFVVGVVLRCA